MPEIPVGIGLVEAKFNAPRTVPMTGGLASPVARNTIAAASAHRRHRAPSAAGPSKRGAPVETVAWCRS